MPVRLDAALGLAYAPPFSGGVSHPAVLHPSQAVPGGDAVVLLGIDRSAGANIDAPSVADDAGNVYTVLAQVDNSVAPLTLAMAPVRNPLTTTSVLQATPAVRNGQTAAIMAAAFKATSAPPKPYGAAIAQGSSSVAMSVALTGDAVRGDLLLAAFTIEFQGDPPPTPAGWTLLEQTTNPAAGLFYKIPTVSGSVSASTGAHNTFWSAAIVAVKGYGGLTMWM